MRNRRSEFWLGLRGLFTRSIGNTEANLAAPPRVAFAAFMDAPAKFELQALYWATSLIESETAESRNDIFLFVPESLPEPPNWAVRLGIHVIPTAYWDPRHNYCNKIGLWQEERFRGYSHVCFTDCDIIFVRRPDLPITSGIAASLVDRPNPRWPALAHIFRSAGLPLPDPVPVRWAVSVDEVTAPTNCNGGFYLVDQGLIGPIGSAWGRWARWLLDTPEIGGPLGNHIDQVSLALALTDLGTVITPLSQEINIPTHIGKLPGEWTATPAVLHYHSHLDNQGNLQRTEMPLVDKAITDANEMIERWKRDGLNNRVFWNARYALFPDLGSGVGSRGKVLEEKRRLLAPFAVAFQSTIDLGCGDIEATRALPFQEYVGVDIAEQALETARQKEPNKIFMSMREFVAGNQTAELVLCLDVLIHQSSRAEYDKLIGLAVERARDLALISGYDDTPEFSSSITFFHEPIGDTLTAKPAISRAERIGKYRDIVLYAAVKKDGALGQNATPIVDLVRAY